MHRSTHEEHQPLQTTNKQFKKAVTFLTGYNGFFNVTNSINNFYFAKSFTEKDDYIQITIKPVASEIESLNNEYKMIFIEEEHFTEADFQFTIKPSFSTFWSIIEISSQGAIFTFLPDDSIQNLLRFNATTKYQEDHLSPNPVDILLFDNAFLGTDIAQGLIFKRWRSGIFDNFTMDVDPGYKHIQRFGGG